ncbi:MAG TPA: YlbF family regulator [Verrucomicrobiae bacterium]
MTATETTASIAAKTTELCEAILADPEFQRQRSHISAFLDNDAARGQYDALSLKGQMLQQKQQMGMDLSEQEIAEFNEHRDALLNNPVAKNFLDAQREVSSIQDYVMKHVAKTFELGRLPAPEDMDDGGCCNSGGGCGCH